MYVQSILAAKGDDVATIAPDATVRDAVALLNERRVGALVVSTDGRTHRRHPLRARRRPRPGRPARLPPWTSPWPIS